MIAALEAHEPRSWIDRIRHYLPDLVYGANDGIVTTFAVVTGVAGASLSMRTALILGAANLFADGFSMGASNFLAIRSSEAVRAARGEGVLEPYPARHALATWTAFIIAGSVPLILTVGARTGSGLGIPVAGTLAMLFLVGALRSLVTNLRWWVAGAEMLSVGAAAALVSYGVGALVAAFV